jgi:effector-binding domain-containing protein
MTTDQIPIGRFSLISHLSLKALRIYDRKGILVPAAKDRITGYRNYSVTQIGTAVAIRTLSVLGFSLEEISRILTAKEQGDQETIRNIIADRRIQVRDEIERLQKISEILLYQEDTLELLPMSYTEPVIKEISQIRVMSIREKGEYEPTIGRLISELCALSEQEGTAQSGFRVAGPPMSIYHDGEYRENDADIEVAFPILGRINQVDERIRVSTLNGGRFLSLIYKGPYMGIHEGWSRAYAYAVENGITLSIPGREIYLNDPCVVPEDELMTEILVPILGEPA